MITNRILLLGAALLALTLGACSSPNSFTTAARSGDTIVLAIGWNKDVKRSELTVSITPTGGGAPIVYSPGDARVRSVANMYPDPASRLVVGTETAQSMGTNASTLGNAINNSVTGQDKDWGQTIVVLDLPTSMPTGPATIAFSKAGTSLAPNINITILSGPGVPNTFAGSSAPPTTTADMLASLERGPSYAVSFNGATVVPHAIQLDLNHTAGTGKTWVVNPRGDLKSATWNDTGSKITVMLTPVNGKTLGNLAHFKFYVSGGVTGVAYASSSLKAYDINGNAITGITTTVSQVN
ncbi:MAG: hypothetical protein V4568_08420 [Pseudomonadota bacterium]